MKKILLTAAAFLAVSGAWPQGRIDEVLVELESNSPTLAALREQANASTLAGRTGLFPVNPEVEFNYLWGHPSNRGIRMDISITQSFDFPSAYAYRSRIAKATGAQADLRYKAERLDFLLEAKRICIDLIYHNAMITAYGQRKADAEALLQAYDKMLSAGGAGILERNRVRLNLTDVEGRYELLLVQRRSLQADLTRLNGGKDIALDLSDFSPGSALPPDFERWYAEAEAKSPVLQYVKGQIEVNDSEARLNRAMSLPKFSAGYMNEHFNSDGYGGLKMGMSVPLWENKNRVKAARAEGVALSRQADDARLKFYYDLRTLFDKARVYLRMASSYDKTLRELGGTELPRKALSAGEISLPEYLRELELYYDNVEAGLESRRNAELSIAELTAVEM